MNRRDFVKALLGTAAAAVVLPQIERLLPMQLAPTWVQGAESLTVGDVFTIEGVYAVQPITKSPTAFLQRFIIASDVTSDDYTEPSIYPRIIAEGPYQNVSNVPSLDATLNPVLCDPAYLAWLDE